MKKNDDELRKLMRVECKKAGGQKFWALANGIQPTTLCEVLLGRKDVTEKMANALGYIYTKYRWCEMPKFD